MSVSLPLLLVGVGAPLAALSAWAGVAAWRAFQGPAMTGAEGLRLSEGVVEEWSGEEGWVVVGGELWRARSENALAPGDRVDVIGQDGLTLHVGWARRRLGAR